MVMDKRIGYGLTFKEAVDLLMENVPETVDHVHIRDYVHGTYWAELRTDGWSVYIPHSSTPSTKKEEP